MGSNDEKKDLDVNVLENVKASEAFGRMDKQLKGIGGTLHLTDEAQKGAIVDSAWSLSKSTGKPVVVVVRAS